MAWRPSKKERRAKGHSAETFLCILCNSYVSADPTSFKQYSPIQVLSGQWRIASIRTIIKKLFAFLVIFLLHESLEAQENISVVKGMLVDKTSREGIANATVALLSQKDTSLFLAVSTSSTGRFEITGMDTGTYQLTITFLSKLLLDQRIHLAKDSTVFDLDTIYAAQIHELLPEVIIKDQSPLIMKGDTLAYRAGNYKTPPGATVEELLKKLPGMQVDQAGTVKAQGEQVQKIYVDGKEFFGTDPTMATKNLTADMIEQVQVFNDKSEQAKLSNIEDGNRIRAINLKLKKDKKKGLFGAAVAGYGTKNRYHAGVSANYFKAATQVSVITGTSNLSSAAAISPVQMASPGNLNALTGTNRNGLSEASSIGFNFHSFIGKGFDINASYMLFDEDNRNQRTAYRQSFFKDSMMTTNRMSGHFSQNQNHRLDLKATVTVDSFNTIVYTNGLVIRDVQASFADRFSDQVHKNAVHYLAGENQNSTTSQESPLSWTNQLAWRKKFKLPGRSLVAAVTQAYNRNDRNIYSDLHSKLFNQDEILYRQWDRNYFTELETGNSNYGFALSFTEPAGKGKWVEINYNYTNNKSYSNRDTWLYDQIRQAYDEKEDSLSSDLLQFNRWSGIGANLRGTAKKLHYQIGLTWQQMLLETDDPSKNNFLSKRFTNLLPLASFNYQLGSGRNLQLQYRGRSNQPDIRQLQDITDITSYPYIHKGNPLLRQEFIHTANVSYNAFNSTRLRSLFFHITYNHIRNRITSSLQQSDAGQIWMPINLNGAYNLNATVGLGFPFFSWEGATIHTNTQIDLYRNVSLVNGSKNNTRDFNIGQDLVLNYNSGEKLDLGITLNSAYNEINYGIGEILRTSFFTHSVSVNSSYSFPKGITVSTLIDYARYTGSASPFNTDYFMWRAAVDKKVFHDGKGSIKLTINDILDRNQNISRIKGSNYTEDSRGIGLQRFAVLSFIYRFNKLIK